jgi:tripartite-type tricarboxylate transporter receptor subunit TctC
MTPEEFNTIVRNDIERWRRMVKDLKLQIN